MEWNRKVFGQGPAHLVSQKRDLLPLQALEPKACRRPTPWRKRSKERGHARNLSGLRDNGDATRRSNCRVVTGCTPMHYWTDAAMDY